MDCLFCKIAKGEIPSKKRFEDDDFFAFDDIHPKAAMHILLIPKRHIHSVAALEDSDEELIGKLMMTAQKVAKENGLESFRLVFNSGADAGQEVDHLHAHILGGERLGPIA
jgi:histidine triad (HIT) family protein